MRSITSVVGTLRHFTATQHFGRFRIEADIDQQARMAGSVANDPKRRWPREFGATHHVAAFSYPAL
jgi:hypothetical protein